MIFSRVSIEFGSSYPDDEASDVDLQKLSDEEINRLGYFRLADASSPCLGAFSSTITSVAVHGIYDDSPLPNPSPPTHLTQTSNGSPIQPPRQGLLRIVPNCATRGLCIDGFSSSVGRRIVSGESLGDITNSPLAFSTDHDDLSSPASSLSDCFVFPPSPDFEIPSPSSPFDDEDDEIFPDDFVGVFYVGYPLRPSQARYDLVGLGLPGDVVPDNRRERFGELGLAPPDSDLWFPLAPPLRRSSAPRSFAYLDNAAISKSSRKLFIIAEEANEDWETPRSISLPCMRYLCRPPTESVDNERTPPWKSSDDLVQECQGDNTPICCPPPLNA